ncbi:MAG: sugar phosphate isomerase/epimerase [Spirochaetia bacterium]|jgi:sugar phosphate isomerase/epimerase|nr:sugar phosphate isomerase/epimerase [Spirochaetia bacterium]
MRDKHPALEVGFHTGAFNSAYFSFRKALDWAQDNEIRNIECGFVDGVTWNHGLGYFPHIASWEDPKSVRSQLDEAGVVLTQLDAAFPISGLTGPTVGVPYVLDAIRYAALLGCPMVDTTDGLHQPEGLSDAQAMEAMKRSYGQIVEVAERYGIVVTIETHGYFTSDIQRMGAMLDFVDSPYLQMTFDTGNVFISGNDPVAFLRAHIGRVAHVHIKDVAPQLADASRGRQTGIGMSHSAIGDGVNAGNIRSCLAMLKDHGFSGAASLECEARGGPVLQRSIGWTRKVLDELG